MPRPRETLCFVIGPIGQAGSDVREHADFLLHEIIKRVLDAGEFGYYVKRADEDAASGMITDRVIPDILQVDLPIADLTSENPNAYYELRNPTFDDAKAGNPHCRRDN